MDKREIAKLALTLAEWRGIVQGAYGVTPGEYQEMYNRHIEAIGVPDRLRCEALTEYNAGWSL